MSTTISMTTDPFAARWGGGLQISSSGPARPKAKPFDPFDPFQRWGVQRTVGGSNPDGSTAPHVGGDTFVGGTGPVKGTNGEWATPDPWRSFGGMHSGGDAFGGDLPMIDAAPGAASPVSKAGAEMGSLGQFDRWNAGRQNTYKGTEFAPVTEASGGAPKKLPPGAIDDLITQRWTGGPLAAGQKSTVNEAGPEAWVPTDWHHDPNIPHYGDYTGTGPMGRLLQQQFEGSRQGLPDNYPEPLRPIGWLSDKPHNKDDAFRRVAALTGDSPQATLYPSASTRMNNPDWPGGAQPIGDGKPGVFTPTEPGVVIPANTWRQDALKPAPHSWENNRWENARRAVAQVNQFYKDNPDAAKQRQQEAFDGQLASDGITRTGAGDVLFNRYGHGFSSPLTSDAPHRMADEKGEVDVGALMRGEVGAGTAAPYHADPLAGTDWGTKSGIAPAKMTDGEMDALIAKASNAALTHPLDVPEKSVATQFGEFSQRHPLEELPDPTRGEMFAEPQLFADHAAAKAAATNNDWRNAFGIPRTGNARQDRMMDRWARSPEGIATLIHGHQQEVMQQHQDERWSARTESSENRADARNKTTMDRQDAADKAHWEREQSFLAAKYGQKAIQTGKPVPYEHKWSDGRITVGFASTDGKVHDVHPQEGGGHDKSGFTTDTVMKHISSIDSMLTKDGLSAEHKADLRKERQFFTSHLPGYDDWHEATAPQKPKPVYVPPPQSSAVRPLSPGDLKARPDLYRGSPPAADAFERINQQRAEEDENRKLEHATRAAAAQEVTARNVPLWESAKQELLKNYDPKYAGWGPSEYPMLANALGKDHKATAFEDASGRGVTWGEVVSALQSDPRIKRPSLFAARTAPAGGIALPKGVTATRN